MGIQLGTKVRDEVTGIEGMATARTTWVYGCERICVERLDKDGSPLEHWFDEVRLHPVPTPEPAIPQRASTGGGGNPPSRSSAP